MSNLTFSDDSLTAVVEGQLPEIANKVKFGEGKPVRLFQNDYAEDLEFAELLLLGMAIKYIGFAGYTVTIVPGSEQK